jgi:hypothetical protein
MLERDWRHLRRLERAALDRYCARVLDDVAAMVGDTESTPHERYLRLYQLLRERDDALAAAFNDLRRTTAIPRLTSWVRLALLTDEEFAGFSLETRETVAALAEAFRPRSNGPRRSG